MRPERLTGYGCRGPPGSTEPRCPVLPYRRGGLRGFLTGSQPSPRPDCGRVAAAHTASVAATSGEMSACDRARDHNHASPSGRRAAPITASSSTAWARWVTVPEARRSTNAPQACGVVAGADRGHGDPGPFELGDGAGGDQRVGRPRPRPGGRPARRGPAAPIHPTPGRASTISTAMRSPTGPASATAPAERSAAISNAIAVTLSGTDAG